MSRVFAAIMALISMFFLFIGVTSSTAKPLMLLFWGVLFLTCLYKLFLKGSRVKN
jgi:hypothetical protein